MQNRRDQGRKMKGNIMLRMYLNMDKIYPNQWCRAENHSIGCCVHRPTLLIMRSATSGFYIEDQEYDVFSGKPLVVRGDMPALREVSAQQVTNYDVVISTGCGMFTCENGTVKISARAGHPGCLQVDIVADSVDSFNETVQALRHGELKPVGSEQTLFEVMSQQVKVLSSKLESSQLSCKGFRERAEAEAARTVQEMACLREELQHFKNRTFWQNIWYAFCNISIPLKS